MPSIPNIDIDLSRQTIKRGGDAMYLEKTEKSNAYNT
jgi:hypothetical protein